MDKPSLTPHSDQLERVLPKFLESVRAEGSLPGRDRIVAEMTEAMLPAIMRAVAKQRDLRIPVADILRGFEGAMANAIMSTICSVTGAPAARSAHAMFHTAVSMVNIDTAIAQRFGDPDVDTTGSTTFRYDNPDRAPGNA